jgi:hypothetical protein
MPDPITMQSTSSTASSAVVELRSGETTRCDDRRAEEIGVWNALLDAAHIESTTASSDDGVIVFVMV